MLEEKLGQPQIGDPWNLSIMNTSQTKTMQKLVKFFSKVDSEEAISKKRYKERWAAQNDWHLEWVLLELGVDRGVDAIHDSHGDNWSQYNRYNRQTNSDPADAFVRLIIMAQITECRP